MATHQIPYDPLLEPPNSPRLPPDGSEFGAPNPNFYDPGSRLSTISMNNRASEYGSISALKIGSESTLALPAGGAGRYKDDPYGTTEHLPMGDMSPNRRSRDLTEKNALYAAPRTRTKHSALLWGGICAGLLVLIAAVAVPVYIFVIKPKMGSSDSSSGSSSNGSGGHNSGNSGSHQNLITTGGDGSTVTKDDGSTFIYNNTFGGYWVYDPANPLNNSARAQSYSPPLSEEWNWGVDKIYG